MRDFGRASEAVNALYKTFADEDYAQAQADYRELLAIPAFRRVLAGILKKGRVFASVAYETNDTNAVMKNIGWREFAVDIYFTANNADGAAVIEAMRERGELERGRKARIDAAYDREKKGNEL